MDKIKWDSQLLRLDLCWCELHKGVLVVPVFTSLPLLLECDAEVALAGRSEFFFTSWSLLTH